MNYVKIVAKNYNEALSELRKKHGEDAIPISHKYIKQGGVLGTAIFAHDMCELTAGINERKKSAVRDAKSALNMLADADVTKGVFGRADDDGLNSPLQKNYASTLELLRQVQEKQERAERPVPAKIDQSRKSHVNAEAAAPCAENTQLHQLEKDIYELKESISKLLVRNETSEAIKQSFVDDELSPYQEMLAGNDFTEEESRKILSDVKRTLSRDDMKDKIKIEKSLKDLLKSKIVVAGPVKTEGRKKIVMFVGPTGVGKTTSLAKLGAIMALKEQKKVAFITIDTYRIAATEQLKKYAEIMKIPIYVVSDQKELKSVIEREKADIVLVDTSGRSHRNAVKISELKSYADQIDYDLEKILCVSAGTKKRDMMDIFHSYEPLEFDSVLITKVDETSFIGNVVDVADRYNKPISYVANGQEVPNDLFVADADRLVSMMVAGSSE